MKTVSVLAGKMGIGLFMWVFLIIPELTYTQTYPAPTDLSALFNNDIFPIVDLTWQYYPGTGFQYYLIERDGDSTGTANIPYYTESVPCFCTFCYRVYAVYDNGISEPSEADCTFDSVPLMSVYPTQLEAWVWIDHQKTLTLNIDNYGGEPLQYSFPDFLSGSPLPGFISDVNPAFATLPPGVGADISINFDATGYTPGTDTQYLVLESNDPYWLYDSIMCVMNTYTPAYLGGVVTDAISHQPINGATVTVGIWQTLTTYDGSYFLEVDAGTYVYYYDKIGYYTVMVPDTTPMAGDTSYYNVEMIPESYPATYVLAENICNEPSPTDVSWGHPECPMEMIYDDGTAEDLFAWAMAGGENAVRFTPSGYPLTVIGGRIFVGDGIWPSGNWMGSQFRVLVYDEDVNGLPGNVTDSILITVNNYNWIDFFGFNISIDSGDFFISMEQLSPSPDAAPVGVDVESPIANRSYAKIHGGSWGVSVYQDFMIRAYITGPTSNPIDYFTIARLSDFDPSMSPELGIMTILGNTNALTYTDTDFQFLPEAWYAHAVQTTYMSGGASPWVYSNIVGMDKGKIVDVTVLDCLGNILDSVEITLMGEDYPYAVYSTDTGMYYSNFDCVWAGFYDIEINKPGFESLIFTEFIDKDTSFVLNIDAIYYPARNLQVDTTTSIAYWDPPLIITLEEDFEGAAFPPAGWQMTTNAIGWFQTTNGNGPLFTIPSWNSQYTCTSDDGGSGSDGSVDYLITPPLGLLESDSFHLMFDSYYDGFEDHIATVEYSYDAGNTWDILNTLTPHQDEWDYIDIDLTAFSGVSAAGPVWFAFHSSDNYSYGSGWAIDNVLIANGTPEYIDFNVFLDTALVGMTDTTLYQYNDLTYGQTYTSCVSVNYECGTSDVICLDFTSGYLRPPEWIVGDTIGQNVMIAWLMDTTNISNDILGYKLYRDSLELDYIPFTGEDTLYYLDNDPEPMCYDYFVSAIHDLSTYGLPGDTGESQQTGPAKVCLVYGIQLPYFEEWITGSFEPFWTAEDNWVINGQYGTPAPCAEFKWDPVLNNYYRSLSSGPINGVYHDAKGQPYVDGKIWLSFELKLEDANMTDNEHLNIDVWSNGIWHTMKQIDNADGSFDWTEVNVDITDKAMGNVFKVRFAATGDVSSDIISWLLDNISIERICYPPTELTIGPIDIYTLELNWEAPFNGSSASEWIMWDNGVNTGDGIGLTGGGVFSVASHWDADMITQYAGQYITKIRFFPYDNAITTAFTLKVWQGPNAGTLVYEEPLSGLVIGAWNDITLTTPVMVDASKELWFGYTCDQPDGENPAGFDAGPGVYGYGDMITLDGVLWEPISNFGFDLNWNLQAMVEAATDSMLIPISYSENSSREFLQYDIYVNDNFGIGDFEYLDSTQDTFYFHYFDPSWIFGTGYTYRVFAVYEDCDAMVQQCIIWEGIHDNDLEGSLLVYPNPTAGCINIESSQAMKMICLLDYSGRMLQCHELSNETQYKIDVSGYEPGVYLLRIDTEQGRTVRKVIVTE